MYASGHVVAIDLSNLVLQQTATVIQVHANTPVWMNDGIYTAKCNRDSGMNRETIIPDYAHDFEQVPKCISGEGKKLIYEER